jgi:hypothetical protein
MAKGKDEEQKNLVQDEDKDIKAEKFFKFFKTTDDFTIRLYRIEERGKRVFVEKYEGRIPEFSEVRDEWGGGKYEYYAHDASSELLDTLVVNIADKPAGSGPAREEDVRRKLLDEMAAYKSLFGGGGDNAILLKLMEMQTQQNSEMTKLIQAVQQESLKAQIEQEKRISKMMETSQGRNSTIADIVEVMELLDRVKGDREGGGMLDKVLASPLTQAAVGYFTAPTPAPATTAPPAGRLSDRVPAEFLEKLTPHTRDRGIEVMAPHVGGKEKAAVIIDQLLKEKGAA